MGPGSAEQREGRCTAPRDTIHYRESSQPPASALMMSPNSSHFSPLNFISCSWLIMVNSYDPGLLLIPGSSTSVRKSFRLAACFMAVAVVSVAAPEFLA